MTHLARKDFGPERGRRMPVGQARRCREQIVNHLRAFSADDMALSFHVTRHGLYLIGTMNTADRSIALVDYALRRRFRFIALRPYIEDTAPVLEAWLERRQVSNRNQIVRYYCALNRKIALDMSEHQVVEHSYFMPKSLEAEGSKTFEREELEQIWEQSLLPLLG